MPFYITFKRKKICAKFFFCSYMFWLFGKVFRRFFSRFLCFVELNVEKTADPRQFRRCVFANYYFKVFDYECARVGFFLCRIPCFHASYPTNHLASVMNWIKTKKNTHATISFFDVVWSNQKRTFCMTHQMPIIKWVFKSEWMSALHNINTINHMLHCKWRIIFPFPPRKYINNKGRLNRNYLIYSVLHKHIVDDNYCRLVKSFPKFVSSTGTRFTRKCVRVFLLSDEWIVVS